MKYLTKDTDSPILKNGWVYSTTSHRPKIRAQLLTEQCGYCAYTERFVAPVDACDIEHFDDRLKNSEDDSYWNWYAVHHWINLRKRSITEFLPILMPYDASLAERVEYQDGAFRATSADDTEAMNLIEFLGWNDPTLAAYRQKHVERIRDMQRLCADDLDGFIAFVASDPESLSFRTVLEAELNIIFS